MSDSCALDAHGNLKDASEITWFNDGDDDIAMGNTFSGAGTLTTLATSANTPSAPHNAFSVLLGRGRSPAAITAGAHCSSCTSKPSGRLCDAQEVDIRSALAKKISLTKWAVTMDDKETLPAHKTRKAMVEDVDNDNDNMFIDTELEELPDLVNNSDDEDDMPDMAYNWMEAMRDADDKVHHSSFIFILCYFPNNSLLQAHKKTSKDNKTADVKMIFTKDDARVNPHTQETKVGWWCNVCLYIFATLICVYPTSEVFASDAGCSKHKSFFKGSIFTLCTHIAQYLQH